MGSGVVGSTVDSDEDEDEVSVSGSEAAGAGVSFCFLPASATCFESMGMAAGSTLKRSPGLSRRLGLLDCGTSRLGRPRCYRQTLSGTSGLTTSPLTLTFLWTTNCLACHTLVAKQALKIKTSNRRSTSRYKSVPMGVLLSFSLIALLRSVSTLPPSRDRPATVLANSCDRLDVVGVLELPWMEGRASGRYHRSNFCSAMWSPW